MDATSAFAVALMCVAVGICYWFAEKAEHTAEMSMVHLEHLYKHHEHGHHATQKSQQRVTERPQPSDDGALEVKVRRLEQEDSRPRFRFVRGWWAY